MARKNQCIAITLKNGVEHIEFFEESQYPMLIGTGGSIGSGKKAYVAKEMWLVSGSGCILARHSFTPQIFTSGATYTQVGLTDGGTGNPPPMTPLTTGTIFEEEELSEVRK